MFDLVAEGLLIALDRIVCGMRPATDRFIDWVRDSAEPPTGLELRAADGALYTGLAMLERSRVVLLLALRVGQAPTYQPAFHPPPGPPPAYQHRLHDPDDPGDCWPPNDPFLHR